LLSNGERPIWAEKIAKTQGESVELFDDLTTAKVIHQVNIFQAGLFNGRNPSGGAFQQ